MEKRNIEIDELELHCIAQHFKIWYYLMIGKNASDNEDTFTAACQGCQKIKECSKEQSFNTFAKSIKTLSETTDVKISMLR